MNLKLTLVIEQGSNDFLLGQIKELPEVLTQVHPIEKVKEDILDALALYLEDMREANAGGNNIIFEGELEVA
ncbi:type II toxin-antitoxin system HicB family antitoxin [Adhaeribacter pallidiroseus]|uniref:Type II toxin-antitoxin system HicB family antitoxin n=1 Tax=Adhaeribacter pallidiroseus TaxID=2072847 RepID=A0A369QGN7_9BACT|nr:hypothetical protein [Adhaeribacter pallidiroseus]RDC62715.1 hypothetical protein AHMF7616_01309 [Adhaeribacter pallidiroseus]